MVLGQAYYSYVLGKMSAFMQTGDIQRSVYTTKLSHICKFFRVYNVDKKTAEQVSWRNVLLITKQFETVAAVVIQLQKFYWVI